jgi:hypothetical protein
LSNRSYFHRSLPFAGLAVSVALAVSVMIASSIARPEIPTTLSATIASLMLAFSSLFLKGGAFTHKMDAMTGQFTQFALSHRRNRATDQQ